MTETVAALVLAEGEQYCDKECKSAGDRQCGENMQMLTSYPWDTMRSECFSSAQSTKQARFSCLG